MDAQGIDAVVLYPSVGLFVPYQPELDAAESADACRRYDDWVAEYCAHDERRLAAVGIAPLADPARAAAETRRAAELGLVAMMARPNHLYGRNLGDRAYDPFYDALEETGLVLAVHEGLGLRGPTIGRDRFDGFALRHACSHPLEQMAAMASLVLDGALERHPHLRVAFLESGTGWVPYWLARLDDHREWMAGSETADLSLSASEYFARQCVVSSDPEDRLAAEQRRRARCRSRRVGERLPAPRRRVPRRGRRVLRPRGRRSTSPRSTRCSGRRRCASTGSRSRFR